MLIYLFLSNRSWWNTLMIPLRRAISGWCWMPWRYTIAFTTFSQHALCGWSLTRFYTSLCHVWLFTVLLHLVCNTDCKMKTGDRQASLKVKSKYPLVAGCSISNWFCPFYVNRDFNVRWIKALSCNLVYSYWCFCQNIWENMRGLNISIVCNIIYYL